MSGLISYGIGYSANSTAATSLVIQPPPVYASGDFLVMGVIAGGTAATGGVAPSLPAGWTRLSATGATLATFWKTASGSESPYTVSVASTAASAGFVAAYPAASVITSSFGQSSSNVTTFTGTFPGGVTSGETVLLVAGAVNNGTNAGYQNFNFPSTSWTTDVPVFGPALPANPDSVQPVAIGLAEVTGSTGNPTLTSTEGCNLYAGFVVLNITGTPPNPYAVTATVQPPEAITGMALTVKALTGAASVAQITASGATESFYASGVSGAPAAAITPNATGSVIYGAVTENFGVTGGNTFTANGSTTFSQNIADVLNSAIYGTVESSGTTTASTPVTIGGSAPDNAYTTAALAEILESSGITEVATATVNALLPGQYPTTAAAQTAHFTSQPATGQLLVAMVSANSAYPAGNASVAITDSLGLTWTQLVVTQYPSFSGVFVASVTSPYVGQSGPVQACIPQVFSKGRVSFSRSTPVVNPLTGPVFRQAVTPARIHVPLPPRGRIASNHGTPVQNPTIGPVFRQATAPARIRITLPPRGRIASSSGGPVSNPTQGAAFHWFCSLVRIHPSLPPRGRIGSNKGAPVENPVIPQQPGGHVALSFSTGRISWNLGGPVRNPITVGPVFYQRTFPVTAKLPTRRPSGGYTSSTPPYVAPPVPPVPPPFYQFYGHVPVYYLDYLDWSRQETLYCVPGGSYAMVIANTRAGLTIPPGDGRWVPGENYDIPLRRKVFLRLREHIHKSRRRSGYRNPPAGGER